MREERTNVLRRLENQEISAEEAAKMLEELDQPRDVQVQEPKKEKLLTEKLGKMFRIKVLSSDGDRVNVQIPLVFAKIALQKGSGFINSNLQNDLDIDVEELFEMIEQGNIGKLVDVESADGDKVEIVID